MGNTKIKTLSVGTFSFSASLNSPASMCPKTEVFYIAELTLVVASQNSVLNTHLMLVNVH